MRRRKKKKRKLRQSRPRRIRMKIPKMPSQKHRHREAWKKRILDRCWLEALKLETMGAEVTAAQEDPVKTKLTLDHGK